MFVCFSIADPATPTGGPLQWWPITLVVSRTMTIARTQCQAWMDRHHSGEGGGWGTVCQPWGPLPVLMTKCLVSYTCTYSSMLCIMRSFLNMCHKMSIQLASGPLPKTYEKMSNKSYMLAAYSIFTWGPTSKHIKNVWKDLIFNNHEVPSQCIW